MIRAKNQTFENRGVKVDAGQPGVRNRKKDVKNEGRSDYVYENKEVNDKMSGDEGAFFDKTARLLY
jgi:hypothetical protein